ncbi:MAG: amidohydrolase family protein [Prolixibacteraceae bacterium]
MNTQKIEGLNYLDHAPISVEIESGLINRIERLEKLSDHTNKHYIAPGLIDIQVNGHSSVSFALEGAGDPSAPSGELTVNDVKKVTEAMWKEGVTSYFPTLTTNSRELLARNFSVLARAKDDPSLLGSLPGFHLEGPYISPVDGYRGAHPLEHVRRPDWDEFMELYKAAGEKIILITIAPEIDGAFEFIRKCRKLGIVVSLGHHNAPAGIIREAIDNGAGLATHLGNGCAGTVNRHFNPIWPQLADKRLTISIIADSFHLPPEMLQVFCRTKGFDQVIITSDITSYAGLPAGIYTIKNGESIEKKTDGSLRFSIGGLYGSATELSKATGNIMKYTGCSLAEAISMVTTNPARLHRLNDRGTLEPGKRADLILFSMEDFDFRIHKTIVQGQLVYEQ